MLLSGFGFGHIRRYASFRPHPQRLALHPFATVSYFGHFPTKWIFSRGNANPPRGKRQIPPNFHFILPNMVGKTKSTIRQNKKYNLRRGKSPSKRSDKMATALLSRNRERGVPWCGTPLSWLSWRSSTWGRSPACIRGSSDSAQWL